MKNISQKYIPNISPFKIRTPKSISIKTKRKLKYKSKLGLPRLSPCVYSNIIKKTVKELLAQHATDNPFNINHKYTNTNKKEPLDSLFNGINSKI